MIPGVSETDHSLTRGILLVVHGTRDQQGHATSMALGNAVAMRFPDREVRLAQVDVRPPHPTTVLNDWSVSDITLVPVFLGAGYHVRTDIPAAAAGHPGVRVTDPLGPEPEIIDALADRWSQAARIRVDRLVLGAAGSSDPASIAQTRATAAALSLTLDREVEVGFCTAADPRLSDVIAAGGSVGVISHLLTTGHFHRQLLASGAHVVTEPIGSHPRLVDLIARRIHQTQPAAQ